MTRGILDLLPGTEWQTQGDGILARLGRQFTDNPQAMIGLGLGLMSGNNPQDAWGNALAGMQRGTLVDSQSAKQKREMERSKALSEAGARLFPQYADVIKANPELASSLIEKKAARDLTPDNGQIIGTGDAGYYRVFRDGRKEQLIPPTGGATQQYDQLVDTRKRQAQELGLKPGDMAYQSFVLTGKMPREDAQPLSATDRKAILEADEGVLAAETAIKALEEAKKLSPKAYQGAGAGARAWAGNSLPDWAVPDMVADPEGAKNSANLENLVTGNALSQLKAIFGGAPTEGERKILLDLQGSLSQPDAVRQEIYNRAAAMAQKRLEFNRQRAAEMRGGSYYKPGGGSQQPPKQGVAPADNRPRKRYNPATGEFE
jgi:hypothetical protein